jgi:glutamyl-tRNA reductase
VLQRFSRSLTNKLTHLPTARLREASAAGRHEVVAHGRRLLGLDAGYHDE